MLCMPRYLAQAVTTSSVQSMHQVQQGLQFYEKPFRGAQNNRVKKKNAGGYRGEKHCTKHAHRFVEGALF